VYKTKESLNYLNTLGFLLPFTHTHATVDTRWYSRL